MRQRIELSKRQARVGIVANPTFVSLPVVALRATMARWPDLRSPRRLRRLGLSPACLDNGAPSAYALDDFANEMRQERGRPRRFLAFAKHITNWLGLREPGPTEIVSRHE